VLYRRGNITTGTYSLISIRICAGPIKCEYDCLVIFLCSILFAANNNEEEEFSLSSEGTIKDICTLQ